MNKGKGITLIIIGALFLLLTIPCLWITPGLMSYSQILKMYIDPFIGAWAPQFVYVYGPILTLLCFFTVVIVGTRVLFSAVESFRNDPDKDTFKESILNGIIWISLGVLILVIGFPASQFSILLIPYIPGFHLAPIMIPIIVLIVGGWVISRGVIILENTLVSKNYRPRSTRELMRVFDSEDSPRTTPELRKPEIKVQNISRPRKNSEMPADDYVGSTGFEFIPPTLIKDIIQEHTTDLEPPIHDIHEISHREERSCRDCSRRLPGDWCTLHEKKINVSEDPCDDYSRARSEIRDDLPKPEKSCWNCGWRSPDDWCGLHDKKIDDSEGPCDEFF